MSQLIESDGLQTVASMKRIKLKDGSTEILIFKDPHLNLFTISDGCNFGPTWIKVRYERNKIFTTTCLLGPNEETMCPVARFFAPILMGVREDVPESSEIVTDESILGKEIILNMSLRNTDVQTIREIASHLISIGFNNVPVIRL